MAPTLGYWELRGVSKVVVTIVRILIVNTWL